MADRAADGRALRRVAASFSPPAGWVLVESRLQLGPGCIDVHCPFLSRRWEATTAPSRVELERLARDAGWTLQSVEGDCRARANATGSVPLCHVDATTDGLDVEVRLAGPVDQSRPYTVTLDIEK